MAVAGLGDVDLFHEGATFIRDPGGHGSPIEQPEPVSRILIEVLGAVAAPLLLRIAI
jgi:hypothetical protein